MELLILSKLKWDLTAITSYDYLDYMINSLDLHQQENVSVMAEVETKVRRNTEKLVTLCATDETFMSMPPSLVAASALVTALEQDKTISNKVNLNQIIGCIKHNTNLEMVSSSTISQCAKMRKKVQFGRTSNAMFASKAKINVFFSIFSNGVARRTCRKKYLKKSLNLAFEVSNCTNICYCTIFPFFCAQCRPLMIYICYLLHSN